MPLETGSPMPSLTGATEWLNATAARAKAEAQGRAVLVHFWSANCDACKANFARVAAWRDRGEGKLAIVAVHAPATEEERDAEIVRGCVGACAMSEPCAVDNEGKLSGAFGHEPERAPAYYLFGADGKLVAYAEGAGGAEEIAAQVESAL